MTNDAAGSFVVGARTGAESTGATVTAFSGQTTLTGTYGQLIIHRDGSYQYNLIEADPQTNALAGGQVVHELFTYKMNFSGLLDTAQLDVTITGANDAPVIAGGNTADITVAENSTAVTTITASDVDTGATRSYTLAGGADQGKFQINQTTGALAFIVAPDYDAFADSGGNNVYDVVVRATDNGGATDEQTIHVTVTNVLGHTINGSKTKGDTINGSKPAGNAATDEEDNINGKGGNDTISALGGNDTVKGGLGVDVLNGAAGIDTVDFSDMTKAVVLTLKGSKVATATVGGVADDKVKNFEDVKGGTAADKLTGDSKANMLTGNKGNDTLGGGTGNDTLVGGAGMDSLTGGGGGDQFRFNAALSASSNVDKITDFVHSLDKIGLGSAIFGSAIGPTLDAGEFYAKAGAVKAHDADDRIIYNKTTGDLYFDKDGKGGAAAILFATLTTHPGGVDGGDFLIV